MRKPTYVALLLRVLTQAGMNQSVPVAEKVVEFACAVGSKLTAIEVSRVRDVAVSQDVAVDPKHEWES